MMKFNDINLQIYLHCVSKKYTLDVFHSLNLLKVTDIGQMQILIFMYKYQHRALPTRVYFSTRSARKK